MSMLHTVNKSPFEKNSLQRCLGMAKPGSAVLLIEDGVYAALRGVACEADVRAATERLEVYALGADLKARGADEGQVVDGVQIVDYGDFVDLAASHDNVQAWV